MLDNAKVIKQGGGVDYLQFCKIAPQFDSYFDIANAVFNMPYCTNAASMFESANTKLKTVELTLGRVTSLARIFQRASKLEEITINADLSQCTGYMFLCGNGTVLRGIYGSPLDFSSVTNSNGSLIFGSEVTHYQENFHVRYKPNTVKVDHTLGRFSGTFTVDSLVSVANGINSASAHTITLGSGNQALLPTIMGTVSQVTDETGTYDFFTKDDSGATTLLDFINNIKGWTVA